MPGFTLNKPYLLLWERSSELDGKGLQKAHIDWTLGTTTKQTKKAKPEQIFVIFKITSSLEFLVYVVINFAWLFL